METGSLHVYRDIGVSINCTLRNGNERLNRFQASACGVLIVPCGMETQKIDTRQIKTVQVLIVPCGMETAIRRCKRGIPARINCTLRNGNVVTPWRIECGKVVLIVPCGMETRVSG